MKQHRALLPLFILLWLAGCGEAPKQEAKKEAKKEPEKIEPISGNTAFFRMLTMARGWAPDVEPVRLGSIHLEGVPQEPGKAAAWQATFVSQQFGRKRDYTYSVIEASGNLHKGAFAGLEESYSARSNLQPFPFQALKIDSTTAYKTATEKGTRVKEYMKKNPDKNISFILERNRQFPSVTWRVIWGDSPTMSNYSVYVDASTGKYLKTAR